MIVHPQMNPSLWAIVHDMPYDDDLRNLTHLSGAVGRVIWPLLGKLAGVTRDDVFVTSVFLEQVDDPTDEMIASQAELLKLQLRSMGVTYVLTLGTTAGKAMLGDRWSKVEVHNGLTYTAGEFLVTPTWHPVASLRPAETSKDPLAWLGAGIKNWTLQTLQFASGPIVVPPYTTCDILSETNEIAIDTEGTPQAPECVTWSDGKGRFKVFNLFTFFNSVREFSDNGGTVWFHNAPWDWQVLRAMGCIAPHKWNYRDTMELAYLKQTEPQGLKDLAERHLGLRMKSWEDVVMPHWETSVRDAAARVIEAGTIMTTHSPKTGKPYKVPKYERSEIAKQLHKLKSVKRMSEILKSPPPSFAFVPEDEFLDYATLDPYATIKVAKALCAK